MSLLRRRMMMAFASRGESPLPSGYIRLPYIKCNGNAYIDTGLYGDRNTVIDYQFMITGGSSNGIVGAYAQNAASAMWIVTGYNDAPTQFLNSGLQFTWPFNEVCTAILSSSGIDGTFSHSWSPTGTRTSNTIYIGKSNGSTMNGIVGRIYYCKIYQNGELIREYVPAINETTSEHGLYDKVNGVFYTSIGSSDFSLPIFSGTATGDFSVIVQNSEGTTVSTTNVPVTNGEFNIELPILVKTTMSTWDGTVTIGQRYLFKGQSAITSITQCPVLQTGCESVEQTFMDCTGLTSICGIYAGDATKLSSMFEGCSSLIKAPKMLTTGVKFMDRFFYGCSSLTTVPSYDYSSILNSEASSVSSLSSMFGMCESLVNVAGMSGLQKDTNFRGCVNLSVQSLLNIANTVAVNPKSGWSGFTPELPPTVGGNDSATDYLNIRVSGTAGSTSAGDGSVRVRMYNNDSAKYTEAVNTLANKGWIVNN